MSDKALELLDVALSALVAARIHALESPEWVGEVESAIDRVSAFIGNAKHVEARRASGPPVFRGVHILRGPLPPCDDEGGCGAGYGEACRPGCPAEPRYV